jgi:thiamine-phosphate pyrophosphorylase
MAAMEPPRLYLITDRTSARGRPLLEVVRAALRGGVDAVQLREKDLPAQPLLELARELRTVCAEFGASLLVNDRIDIALAVDADGVHLPVSSFRAADARTILGPGKLIGASAHNLAEATTARNGGADFIVFGPIFDTESKRDYGKPLGPERLTELTRGERTPVLAIGGVTPDRVQMVCERGAAGVAVLSGILAAEDPEAAARAYRSLLP